LLAVGTEVVSGDLGSVFLM